MVAYSCSRHLATINRYVTGIRCTACGLNGISIARCYHLAAVNGHITAIGIDGDGLGCDVGRSILEYDITFAIAGKVQSPKGRS